MIDPGEVVLFGAGGHAAVVADAAVFGIRAGRRARGPASGRRGTPLRRRPPARRSRDPALARGSPARGAGAAAVGDPAIRRRLADRLDVATIVHPSASCRLPRPSVPASSSALPP